jgi:hypothetical protein
VVDAPGASCYLFGSAQSRPPSDPSTLWPPLNLDVFQGRDASPLAAAAFGQTHLTE